MILYKTITTMKDELYPRNEQLALNSSEGFEFFQVMRHD